MDEIKEYDSGKLFKRLAYGFAIVLALVGFLAGLTSNVWMGLILAVSFFAVTLGAAYLIGFLVKRIFKTAKEPED